MVANLFIVRGRKVYILISYMFVFNIRSGKLVEGYNRKLKQNIKLSSQLVLSRQGKVSFRLSEHIVLLSVFITILCCF